jgi:hypothetical protein
MTSHNAKYLYSIPSSPRILTAPASLKSTRPNSPLRLKANFFICGPLYIQKTSYILERHNGRRSIGQIFFFQKGEIGK